MDRSEVKQFVNQCRSGFLERIANLHNQIHEPNPYSDMIIRLSDGTELFCHRNIVCGQCAFFEKALQPGRFKESFTGIVELPADPPQAIEALIEFLYKLDYSTPPNLAYADQALFHLDVYHVADIYQLPELRKWADQLLCGLVEKHWEDIVPLIPCFVFELPKRYKEDSYGHPACLKLLCIYCIMKSPTLLVDDDIWTGLHREVPLLMGRVADLL